MQSNPQGVDSSVTLITGSLSRQPICGLGHEFQGVVVVLLLSSLYEAHLSDLQVSSSPYAHEPRAPQVDHRLAQGAFGERLRPISSRRSVIRNPYRLTQNLLLREEPPGRVRWISKADVELRVAAARTEPQAPHLPDLILLGLNTGVRMGEMLGFAGNARTRGRG